MQHGQSEMTPEDANRGSVPMETNKPERDAIREGEPSLGFSTRDDADEPLADPMSIAKPTSRTRRIAGLVSLIPGAIIVLRMLWLVAMYWEWFGEVEWLRFWTLLWFGTILTLIGVWLRYRSCLAGVVAAILAVGVPLGMWIFVFDH